MLNVVTVKWGTKYSSEDVNRIHKQCRKYLSMPFKFFCYTEDEKGLDAGIHSIPYCDEYQLEGVWNKMALFKPGIEYYKGKCLYLDLDVVILNNIDSLVQYTDEFCAIKCFWKSSDYVTGPSRKLASNYGCDTNTSIMTWVAGTTKPIWDTFVHNLDYNIIRYTPGMDRFMYHNNFIKATFPKGWVYSYLHGTDYLVDDANRYRPKVLDNFLVCILNGDTTEDDYIPFIDYVG